MKSEVVGKGKEFTRLILLNAPSYILKKLVIHGNDCSHLVRMETAVKKSALGTLQQPEMEQLQQGVV